ncbi:MAG: S8 family serine peptidase [Candidatus Promineifilaceae bacterium]
MLLTFSLAVGSAFSTSSSLQTTSESDDRTEQLTLDSTSLEGTNLQAVAKVDKPSRYIIAFDTPAVLLQTDGKSRATVNSVRSSLISRQAAFVTSAASVLGRSVDVRAQFTMATNGMVLELTAAEAAEIEAMAGVARVEPESYRVPLTDVGPAWVGAPNVWDGTASGSAALGDGVVVAILDTGINMDHISFAATDRNGYTINNPLGSGNFLGSCDSGSDQFDANAVCSDKLIGAWDAYRIAGITGYSITLPIGEDENGHGSHTASTAAGNFITASLTYPAVTGTVDVPISGVAPHANIISYDVCNTWDPVREQHTCAGSASLAAIDQVALDLVLNGAPIGALNYSISGGGDPYSDLVDLGFLALTNAGVFVSASAGNSGPDASTLGHQGPWMHTVAASTHNRSYVNGLNAMMGGAAPADMTGAGITDGYGPAPIVYAGDYPNSNDPGNDPAQCLQPYPAGTFSDVNGSGIPAIVVCDRGAIARTAKGQNVLAGGAGGFVLANVDANGESVSADAHFLPGVHVGDASGDVLRSWLATNSSSMPYTATIAGFTTVYSDTKGDIMASFSSRGPNSALDVIKPDITAPGVDILANDADGGNDVANQHEYQSISGTSMSSPHNAGAGALMKQLFPDWTVAEIKSALMMSAATDDILKEDGATEATPFDRGSGSMRVNAAAQAGLTMDETRTNFLAADPANNGDPKTLNLASMMDSACSQTCSWTRTVKNPTSGSIDWSTSFVLPSGFTGTAVPSSFTLAAGATQEIVITVDSTGAALGWTFGQLDLTPSVSSVVAAHMPIAINVLQSTDEDVIKKVASRDYGVNGDSVSYTVTVANPEIVSSSVTISDILPSGMSIVSGSLSAGANYDAGSHTITWNGDLGPSGESLGFQLAAPGYLSLASLGVSPFGMPSNPDDGCWGLTGLPPFTYLGQTHTSVIFNVNGTLQLGQDGGSCTTASNSVLPSPTTSPNMLAPWWTDLDGTSGGNLYAATFNGGLFTIFEWEAMPKFNDSSSVATFQIWLVNGGNNQIFFAYDSIVGDTSIATVGAQNGTKTVGSTAYYNGGGYLPSNSADLFVNHQTFTSDPAVLTYQTMINTPDPMHVNTAKAQIEPISSRGTIQSAHIDASTYAIVESVPSIVGLNVTPTVITEDMGTDVMYTIEARGTLTQPITVDFSVGGTATYGTDYTVSGASSFTATTGAIALSPASPSATITISANSDTDVELDETIILTLLAGSNYLIDQHGISGIATIMDDDVTVLSVAVASTAVITEDGGASIVYTVAASGVLPAGDLIVNLGVGGTAAYVDDYSVMGATSYTSTTGSVTLSASSPTATMTMTIQSDARYEPDETIILTISGSNSNNYRIDSANASATGTIIDDDYGYFLPVYIFEDSSVTTP